MNRAAAFVTSTLVAMTARVSAPTAGRLSNRRAVSMLEYVLIAAVILGVIAVAFEALGGGVSRLLDAITGFLDSKS